MNYENRIVLFLDILGFRSIIDKTVEKNFDNTKAIETLYKNLTEIKEFLISRLKQKQMLQYSNISLKVTQFSDSIIISFVNDDNSTLLNLIRTIQELILKLVNNGILCRGAISYGKLIHDNRVIFGPALNDAYETETKAALYPRIILDKSLIEIGKQSKTSTLFQESINNEDIILGYLTQDSDDKYYIDYFPKDIGNYKYVTDIQVYLANLRLIIINGSRHTKPDLKVKYGWMKNKYNNLLSILKDESKIKEISKVKGLYSYIEKLSPIK
jgi:hypothetical protein